MKFPYISAAIFMIFVTQSSLCKADASPVVGISVGGGVAANKVSDGQFVEAGLVYVFMGAALEVKEVSGEDVYGGFLSLCIGPILDRKSVV